MKEKFQMKVKTRMLVGWLIDSQRPGKQCFSHVGTEPPLPGYYQYFKGVNVPCSRTQHGLSRVGLEQNEDVYHYNIYLSPIWVFARCTFAK